MNPNQPPQGYGYPQQQQQGGYGQPQQAYAPPPMAPPSQAASKGFMAGLFDLSFSTFIATRVVKVLYVLTLLLIGLGLIGGVISGILTAVGGISADSFFLILTGLGQVVLTPVFCLLGLTYARVIFESIIVFFRMSEHLAEINQKTR
jgi:hypothetical protein